MSAVTLADPGPGSRTRARPAASVQPTPARARPPRMLLPPCTEPDPRAPAASQVAVPQVRSVLSPLTDGAWPVASRRVGGDPKTELPDPTRLCGAVVLAAVEALCSARPLGQLARWVSPEVYESLARAARPSLEGSVQRGAVVRGLRVCRISPTVAEGSAVLHDGVRVRAAAVRFEVHRGSWRATVLQIG